MTTIRLAHEGVFRTIQGEGALFGLPTIFVRLSGCSVACAGCDTNYQPYREAVPEDIAVEAKALMGGSLEWAWITGGEPTDQDGLGLLVRVLRSIGLKVALATAGTRTVTSSLTDCPDFLSVSPHRGEGWMQRAGNQLNLVPGLGGLNLEDPALIDIIESCWKDFGARFASPMMDRYGRVVPSSLAQCRKWVDSRRGWRLGAQGHRLWGMP